MKRPRSDHYELFPVQNTYNRTGKYIEYCDKFWRSNTACVVMHLSGMQYRRGRAEQYTPWYTTVTLSLTTASYDPNVVWTRQEQRQAKTCRLGLGHGNVAQWLLGCCKGPVDYVNSILRMLLRWLIWDSNTPHKIVTRWPERIGMSIRILIQISSLLLC